MVMIAAQGLTKLSSVSTKRYPKEILPQNIAFRCYKSAPATATIQLRSGKTYTTAAYVDANQLRKIISDLEKVLAEIADRSTLPLRGQE